jgi:hypothetical protein
VAVFVVACRFGVIFDGFAMSAHGPLIVWNVLQNWLPHCLLAPVVFVGARACVGSAIGRRSLNTQAPTLDATLRLRRRRGLRWASTNELGETPEVLRRGSQQHFVSHAAQTS